jgi:hypothetical protein
MSMISEAAVCDEQPTKPENEGTPAWDRAVEAWKAERRAEFERKKLFGRMQSAATQRTLS